MKLIRLFGLGGTFKTSLLNKFDDRFIKVPECNREFQSYLTPFSYKADVIYNLAVKRLVLESLMRNNSDKVLVMDKSFFDYYFVNEIIKLDYAWQYRESYSDKLTKEVINEYDKIFDGHELYDVLLTHTDDNFIHKIIDESNDERAHFFEYSSDYIECKKIYRELLLDTYTNIYQLNYPVIDDIDSIINNTYTKIINFAGLE